ncbi:MAG: TolB family protein [Candidatus Acidiferrales bacterium]
MQVKSRLAFWLLVVSTAILPSCGGYINNPAPRTISLDPDNIDAGHPAFVLTVNGKNLTPTSAIEWSGTATNQTPQPLASIFLSQDQMQVTIPALFVQVPGSAFITVFTPSPGGGMSNPPLKFKINPVSSPLPQITSLSPSGVLAGSNGLNLLVTGKNFVATSVGTVDNSTRPTGFSNSTSLQISLSASDVATAGVLQIAVINPPPNGGTSDPFPLSVRNPVPLISSLSPTTIQAGGTPTALTVNGTAFVKGSQILINGAPRTTAPVSGTQLTTPLTTADLAVGGVNQVQVLNPGPGGGPSNILTFAVDPTLTLGLPVVLDLAPDGSLANNGVCGPVCTGGTPDQTTAGPSTSTTGGLVAYASISSNLVPGNGNTTSDIFLRTTCLATTCIPRTILLSTDSLGGSANGPSTEPVIDGTGAHVAFTSKATNIDPTVPLDGTSREVYWRPTCTTTPTCVGTSFQSQLISISADGLSAGTGESYNPAISSDGRYVAFVSTATNLVSNVSFDGITPQVFVRDTCLGVTTGTCTPTTFLLSTGDGITPANGGSAAPTIATSGLFVSFASTATNLGATAPNPGGLPEIFVRGCTFAASVCTGQTQLVSTPDGATPANGSNGQPAIGPSGRFIAFASTATNLGTNSGGVQQIYVRDTCAGITTACTATTVLVSTPDGTTPANAISERPGMNNAGLNGTALGPIVAFASLASNLSLNTANGVENIFVRKTCVSVTTTCAPSTIVASQAAGTLPPPASASSFAPSISSDGHSVSFLSFANNLVALPTNGLSNIFLASTTF